MGSEQPTSGPGAPSPADADLLRRTADGNDTAFEEFFRRHAVAVRRYARDCCRDTDSADDLTTEAFARTLREVRAGASPEAPERIRLLVTVRRVAVEWTRVGKDSRLHPGFARFAALAEDDGSARSAGPPAEAGAGAVGDAGAGAVGDAGAGGEAMSGRAEAVAAVRTMREAERSEVVRAFRGLPAHWQTLLWHTVVEAESPENAARLLGLRPEAAAALARRAREGLEQGCLRLRLAEAPTGGRDCARVAPLLAACAEGGPRARTVRGLRRHLAACARCRAAVRDAADAGVRLRMTLPVAVLGPFAAGYSRQPAGATVRRRPGGGAGASPAAAEGAGVLARMGLAAAVAAAATATLVVLSGDVGAPDSGPRVGLAPAPATPWEPGPSSGAGRLPAPEAPPGPEATPAQTRREAAASEAPSGPEPDASRGSTRAAEPTEPAGSGGASSDPSSPGAVPSASGGPPSSPSASVSGPSQPSSAPAPTSAVPSVEPKPAPLAYDVGELAYDTHGDGTGPEVRGAESSWLWPRQGLRIGGELFSAGVTVQARSSVTIDLNRACVAFEARVGLDDLRPVPGAARFSVHGDGALLWRSGVLRDGDAAVPVRVSLADVRTVRLVVEPYRRSPQALADWAGARINCR